jgi:DNA polymerase-1
MAAKLKAQYTKAPATVAPAKPAAKRTAKAKVVEQLAYGQPDCKKCKLCSLPYGGRREAGWGKEGAKTMLIFNSPVSCPAGQLSNFVTKILLRLAKIDPAECWVTYACLCPTAGDKEPTAVMLRSCNTRLLPEIYWHSPELVITFGNAATAAALPGHPVARYHGKLVDGGDRCYMPMYDPFDADESPWVNEQLISDFKYLPQQQPVKEIEGIYAVSYEPVVPQGNDIISCDTETVGLYGKLLGGAVTQKVGQATYMPFDTVVTALNKHPAPHLLCHNAKYDLHVLLDNGFKGHQRELDDTEVLAYCMNYDNLKLKVLETQELNLTHPDYDTMAEKGSLVDVPIEETAKYCSQDTDATLRLWQYLTANCSPQERKLYETCDKPLIPCLVNMERKGIAVDLDYVKQWEQELNVELKKATDGLYGGKFDITEEIMASPQQLGKWLFDRGIDLPFTERSKQYKTSKRILAQHMHTDEVIPLILRIRQIGKLQSTYINALYNHTREDGRLHTRYNSTRVVTSRLSSSGPNLQNLPHIPQARRPFVAKPGYKLIRIDFSQIDMMLLAYISQDKNLMGVFQRNEDIHNFMSDMMFGDHEPLHRYNVKGASYACIYGGGAKAMYEQQNAPMGTFDFAKWGKPPTLEQCKLLLDNYKKTFQRVTEWHEEITEFAKEHGYIEDYYGRRRYLPALNSLSPQMMHRAIRQVLNFPIAGTAAGVFKLAIIAASPISTPVLNVHDELVFEVLAKDAKRLAPILTKAMKSIDSPAPLKAEPQIGDNLGEMM